VRLDKGNGTESGWIPFDEKRPEYSIDPVAGRVFVKMGDGMIAAHTSNP
jgi:hypothetical protein